MSLLSLHIFFVIILAMSSLSNFLKHYSCDHSCHVALIIILPRSFLFYFLKCLSYHIIIPSLFFASCHETTLNKTLFKGTVSRDILLQVFFEASSPKPPENSIGVTSNFFRGSRCTDDIKNTVANLPLVSMTPVANSGYNIRLLTPEREL